MIERIKTFFEKQAFGVCDWWGNFYGIPTSKIRIFFIYASFLTAGSPIIIYLIMAFVLRFRNMTRQNRGGVWDL